MRKNIKKIITIAMICSTMVFTGCNIFPEEDKGMVPILSKTNKVEYRTYKVDKGDIYIEDQGYGIAKSLNRHVLYSSMSGGRLKNVYFNQGDMVKKGDVIAELYSEGIEDEIELQELNVQVAQIKYDKLKSENAKEYEQNLAHVTLKYETKKLDQMIRKRDSFKFSSPIDGIITKVTDFQRGKEMISSDIIAVVDGSDEIVIHATKIKNTSDLYSEGMAAIITYSGHEYPGEVLKVEKNKNGTSAFIKFKDEIPEGLKLDKNISYRVVGEKKEEVIRIPNQALFNSSDYHYVFVLDGGVKVRKIVEVGMITNKYVEIISGLDENELVILK
ncbi:efflux RND transporter periplasmic adaptor subunit [Oceanirhabdus sp. W0125-5]|uniref:efflux RND transporter periplasmic adaptor subunit n=1 Tax=Oceanirhabdus sp. W0125-5 TaxID=2999116 RepID=UPI0022F2D613|nr:biotin/lipoyl-binding protein [Oceanirhabdus sp. W0125-5]WBW95610.1 biotin/lipoyl-binding protein [Oceanirhabdus sp. W0125-5]